MGLLTLASMSGIMIKREPGEVKWLVICIISCFLILVVAICSVANIKERTSWPRSDICQYCEVYYGRPFGREIEMISTTRRSLSQPQRNPNNTTTNSLASSSDGGSLLRLEPPPAYSKG